jgi:hypothetical protein
MTNMHEQEREKYRSILWEGAERDPRNSVIGFCVEDGNYLAGTAGCYYFHWLMSKKDLTLSIINCVLDKDAFSELRDEWPDIFAALIAGDIPDEIVKVLHRVTGDIQSVIWIGEFSQLLTDAIEFPEAVRSKFYSVEYLEQHQENVRQRYFEQLKERGSEDAMDEEFFDDKILFPKRIAHDPSPIPPDKIDAFISFIRSLQEPRSYSGKSFAELYR